jgi:polysaccharide export outer membrane protein
MQQAEKKIGGLLEKGGYLKKAQVNLLITTLASQQVSVLGQVNRPGRYPVEGKRKVLDLLAIAGGIGQEGSDMVSLVRTRNGSTTRETIDIVDMVRKGELNRDYEVAGGDIIFVERAPRAYITGEVQRPGPFRIERGMTVQQAVSAGGGLTARGSSNGMRITRAGATIDAKAGDLVQPDDVITVRESWF